MLRHWPPAGADNRFPRSTPEPRPSSRHLHAGQHLANQQAPARLIPGQTGKPGSAVIQKLTTRHQWIACARLLGPYLTHSTARLFPQRSTPRLLTAAPCGGLRPPPAGRPRRTTSPNDGPAPPSLMQLPHQLSPIFYSSLLVAYVAHPVRAFSRLRISPADPRRAPSVSSR